VSIVGHGSNYDPHGIGTDPFPGLGISHEDVARAFDDPDIHAEVKRLAEDVQEAVKSYAPVFGDRPARRESPADGSVGEYRDSIHIEWVTTSDSDLPVARVISKDMKAAWIEFGSSHMPEYAPFTKAAQEFGGRGPAYTGAVGNAQEKFRHAKEALEHARREGSREDIALAAKHFEAASVHRSEALKSRRSQANRSGRGGGNGGRRRR
jgi:hypothetical protein